MKKIILHSGLYNKLDSLCEVMSIGKEDKTDVKVADNLRKLYNVSNYLAGEYGEFSDRTDDVLSALYDKDFVTGIEGLMDLVAKISGLRSELDELNDALKGTLISLRALTEPSSFKPLYCENDVRAAIDNGLEKTDFMSLGYNNGRYALLFEVDENDHTQLAPPFIFAEGGPSDLDEARAYIENFFDME